MEHYFLTLGTDPRYSHPIKLVQAKGFPGGKVVNNLPTNAGDIRDMGSIQGQEDPPEEEMINHSSIFAWRIPWTEEPVATVHWVAKKQTRLRTHTEVNNY